MQRPGQRLERNTWAVLAITWLALAFRLLDLGRHSLWFDEALEVGRAGGNLAVVLFGRPIDQDPPLMALGLRAWLTVGRSEWWLRLPSALLGTSTVFLSARWAGGRLGPRIGVYTALLMASAPVLVHYSQELNQYAALALAATILLVAWDRVLRHDRRRDWGLLGGTSVLGLATHYGMAFPVGATVCSLIGWAARQDRSARLRLQCYLGCLGAAVALLLALGLGDRLGIWHLQRRFGGTYLGKEVAYLADVLWREVLVFFLLPFSGGPALWAVRLLVAISLLGAWTLWRQGGSGRRLVGISLLLSLALVYPFDGFGRYPIGHRYVLFAAPPFLITLAAGLDRLALRQRWLGHLVTGSTVILFVAFAPQQRWSNPWLAVPREELRTVLETVSQRRHAEDLVYVYHGAVPTFDYYVSRPGPGTIRGTALSDEPRAAAEGERIAAFGRPAWLLMAHETPGERERLLAALADMGYRAEDWIEAPGAAAIRTVPAKPRSP